MTYSEKLKHPKWQKRRLQILQRDEFACQLCGDEESTLHIHHKNYRKCEVWEYKDEELITYCELCHLIIEYFKKDYTDAEIEIVKKEDSKFDSEQINVLVLFKVKSDWFISILYFNKNSKVLTDVVSISKNTINKMNSLINDCAK